MTLLIIQNQWRANIDSNFYNNRHWSLEQMDPVEPEENGNRLNEWYLKCTLMCLAASGLNNGVLQY